MKNNTTQQEVLLLTGTCFSSRQYQQKDNTDHLKGLSENEKLKEACWNGMLRVMLPEIFWPAGPEAKLYLWQMRESTHLFALEMGEYPSDIDYYSSIDPYCFMDIQEYN